MAASKISKLEQITLNALDSENPFNTPMPAPRIRGVKQIEPVRSETIDPEPERATEPIAAKEEPIAAEEEVEPVDLKPLAKINVQEFESPIIASRSAEGLPSYRCEFAGRDIFVGYPCYKTTNPATAAWGHAVALDFGRDKIRFDWAVGDGIISRARNRLVHKFLETDARWMLMIDDDIIPSAGRPAWMRSWVEGARSIADVPLQRHIIHRLIGSGKTLISGAYFGRRENAVLICSDKSLSPRAKVYEDAIVEVDWVGAGCLLINRKVFQDIKEKFGDELKVNANDYEYDFFRQFNSEWGEDTAFCKRAKEAGHNAYIDLGTPVFHIGYKTY